MNTLENNKLIAEFLGYSQPHPDFLKSTYWYKKGKDPLVYLSFNTDWNWLMEVVEKIENQNYSVDINKQEENDYQCNIVKNQEILFSRYSNIKIQCVYESCIDFIKWYNENK
jgi:hypothetical protein